MSEIVESKPSTGTTETMKRCGIVMPISTIDSCSEEHWRDVKNILSEAIEDAGFTPQLVSEADEVGIIQKTIIQNLYENPVVVCDVSSKNPNVMFELGMRLAFDRPTIIVKDDKTSYSFDTSVIEHLAYPRDLRFSKIVDFKEALAEKILATYEKATTDKNYTTFLKHFGTFKVAEITTEVVPQDRLLLEEVKGLRDLVLGLAASAKKTERDTNQPNSRILCLRSGEPEAISAFEEELKALSIKMPRQLRTQNNHTHFRFFDTTPELCKQILLLVRNHVPDARWLPSSGT